MTKTLDIYNQDATSFADRFEQAHPVRIYELVQAFFHPGAPTLDVGSGSGRDVAYLNQKNFKAIGVEASEGLIKEARSRHSGLEFKQDSLPELKSIDSDVFSNVLCNAVIMHLTEGEIVSAVLNILRVLKVGGRLILSYRGPSTDAEDRGRLFTKFSPSQIAELIESLGGKVLLTEERESQGKLWHTLVAEKLGIEKKDGIARIQDVITNDNKTATYKLALLRSLCDLARTESHTVIWDPNLDFVIVPLERLALSWLRYYWTPINKGIRQTTNNDLAFARFVRPLIKKYPNPRDVIENYESANPDPEVVRVIKEIAKTINDQPVRYAGGGKTPIFLGKNAFIVETTIGWKNRWYKLKGIKVPADMWRQIRLFYHWIEKSLIVEWVEQTTEKYEPSRPAAEIFKMLYQTDYSDKRDTAIIRKLIGSKIKYCVWSGKKLKADYEIDHAIPYAIWRNNDLWNLLPANKTVNQSKKHFLPHPDHIQNSKERIIDCWNLYSQAYNDKFERQLERSLGRSSVEFSLEDAIRQLALVSTQLHLSRGVDYFKLKNEG